MRVTKKKAKKVVKKVTKRPARTVAKKPAGFVMVGRFGSDPISVPVSGNSTVGKVLQYAQILMSESEKVWVNGTRATSRTKVAADDVISVVSQKQAGA